MRCVFTTLTASTRIHTATSVYTLHTYMLYAYVCARGAPVAELHLWNSTCGTLHLGTIVEFHQYLDISGVELLLNFLLVECSTNKVVLHHSGSSISTLHVALSIPYVYTLSVYCMVTNFLYERAIVHVCCRSLIIITYILSDGQTVEHCE